MSDVFAFSTLYAALGAVLGDSLAEQLEECMAEAPQQAFRRPTPAFGSIEHRFEEWLTDHLKRKGSFDALISQLGKGNSREVIAKLDPARVPIGLATTGTLSGALLQCCGVPSLEVRGRKHYAAECERLKAVIGAEREGDKIVASDLRNLSERLLREVALVNLRTPLAPLFVEAIVKDQNIRLPGGSPERAKLTRESLALLLADTQSGDLGFLLLLVARAGEPIRRGDLPTGAHLLDAELLTESEERALEKLRLALRPYAHFKAAAVMPREALQEALEQLTLAVASMTARRAIPDAVVIFERVTGMFGTYYVGRNEEGEEVRLRTEDDVAMGCRLLYREVSNPVRRVAGWARGPWP